MRYIVIIIISLRLWQYSSRWEVGQCKGSNVKPEIVHKPLHKTIGPKLPINEEPNTAETFVS